MPTDVELLQRYVRQHDERAFAELVQRHLGFVYATAHRSTGGRAHLAEDVAQKVFTQLARKAASLSHHPTLTGWLYRSARYASQEVSRAELRRQRVNQSFATMPDPLAPLETAADWEQLRPVLDEAMEGLKEQDREIMLLRFFQGLTFAEVGEELGLSENAARMRTGRALDKLRGHLCKRGVTSTTSALSLLLANQTFAQVPMGLATCVTTTALAAAPAGALATVLTHLISNKIAVASLGAGLAAGITTIAWATVAAPVSDAELAALRAENTRLKQATAVGAPATTLAAVADEYAAQTVTLVQAIGKRLGENHAAGSSGHRNHGQATPYEAFLTYVWAIDAGESEALENLLLYDDRGREDTKRLHASMPATIRAAYPTPEKLVAFLFIADSILRPIMKADMLADYAATEVEPGHVAVRRKDAKRGGMHWIQTPAGWKLAVPHGAPEVLAKRTLGNEMLDKLGMK